MKTSLKLCLILTSIILMSGKCTNNKQAVQDKPDLLLVIAIDVSSSMDYYRNASITKAQLENIATAFINRRSNVCICITFIGSQIGSFERLMLNKVPQVNVEDRMSIRANQHKQAEKVKSENLQNIQQFLSSLSLDRKNEERTCLNESCADISILLSEPQYANYLKIVCIYSDGFQDINGDNIAEQVTAKFTENVQLSIIGWKNNDQIKHEGATNYFFDMQGFRSYINTLIH